MKKNPPVEYVKVTFAGVELHGFEVDDRVPRKPKKKIGRYKGTIEVETPDLVPSKKRNR